MVNNRALITVCRVSTLRGFKMSTFPRFDENAGANSGRPLGTAFARGPPLGTAFARGPGADTQASSSIALPPCAIGTLVRASALEVQVPDHVLGVGPGRAT